MMPRSCDAADCAGLAQLRSCKSIVSPAALVAAVIDLIIRERWYVHHQITITHLLSLPCW